MKRLHLIIFIALLATVSADAKKQKQLVILHTNDTHSTIMPLNENLDNKDLAGRGGFLRRVNMIQEQRQQHPALVNRRAPMLDQRLPGVGAHPAVLTAWPLLTPGKLLHPHTDV